VSPLAQSAEFELKGIDSSERNSLFFAVSNPISFINKFLLTGLRLMFIVYRYGGPYA
jgi:hypothetical protein